MIAQKFIDADGWRKRVIGCIAGYYRTQNRYQELDYYERLEKIKSTAMRIAKCDNFNDIQITKLRSIFNEFKNKQ